MNTRPPALYPADLGARTDLADRAPDEITAKTRAASRRAGMAVLGLETFVTMDELGASVGAPQVAMHETPRADRQRPGPDGRR